MATTTAQGQVYSPRARTCNTHKYARATLARERQYTPHALMNDYRQ